MARLQGQLDEHQTSAMVRDSRALSARRLFTVTSVVATKKTVSKLFTFEHERALVAAA